MKRPIQDNNVYPSKMIKLDISYIINDLQDTYIAAKLEYDSLLQAKQAKQTKENERKYKQNCQHVIEQLNYAIYRINHNISYIYNNHIRIYKTDEESIAHGMKNLYNYTSQLNSLIQ